MKKVVLTIVFFCSQATYAALPPRYQNTKDLDVIIGFISEHPKVVSTLKLIDFERYTVFFGDECKALFGRRVSIKPMDGWVGPADPLEFKSSNCDID